MPDPHGPQPDPNSPANRVPLTQPSATKQSTAAEAAAFLQEQITREKARADGLSQDLAALRAEYINADDLEAPEKVKKNIRALMPTALEAVEELLSTGKEATRSNLAKWIIDRGLNPDSVGGGTAADKELTKMLGELQDNES